MKPRNTIPKNGPIVEGDRVVCAALMPLTFFLQGAMPEATNDLEREFRQEKGEMYRRELIAFYHTMKKLKGPRQRERFATEAAELMAIHLTLAAKSYQRKGRHEAESFYLKKIAVVELEGLKDLEQATGYKFMRH